MNTDQILSDLAIIGQVIRLKPTHARLAAAAVMLRAAAAEVEAAATETENCYQTPNSSVPTTTDESTHPQT